MALLDQGPETVRVFPSETYTDSYDGPQRRPGTVGIDVPGVFMIPGVVTSRTDPKYAEDVSSGQDASRRYTLIGPDKAVRGGTGNDLRDLDPFAQIEWPIGSGDRWDVNGGVTHHQFPPRLASYNAQLVGR